MVFARTKLIINENVFSPRDTVAWEFPVKDTKRFYEQFKEMVMDSFAIDERQIQETAFNWDKSNSYKTKWTIIKELDDLTHCLISIKLNAKTSDDGSGNITIEVQPVVKTEYPQDTIFQKSFFYEIGRMLTDRMFYEKQRYRYVAEMQRLGKKFENAVKRFSLT